MATKKSAPFKAPVKAPKGPKPPMPPMKGPAKGGGMPPMPKGPKKGGMC